MDIELIEIRDFLAVHHPFDALPEDELDRLPRLLSIRYFRRGTAFPPVESDGLDTFIIRKGAIELRNERGDLLAKLAEGDICPLTCGTDPAQFDGVTVEDTLCYLLPRPDLERLCEHYPEFAAHFDESIADRLRRALQVVTEETWSGTDLMTVRAADLLNRSLVAAPPDISIREAARIMTENRVSSLILMENERLAGLVTDRDLRTRCITAGLSSDRPVREIMTEQLHTTEHTTLGFRALVTMSRLNVHHLPVLDGERVVGILSTSDFVRFQTANAIYLVSDIRKAPDQETLVQISAKVPELQVHLVTSGATASHVGEAVSAVTDAITQRLLELAEAELGPAPVPYAWLAGGSQARREQSSHSDQDNALLLAEDYKAEHDGYFSALAERVNGGLDACGYYFCPGEVMASNPKWRQPLAVWRDYFANWIERPDPKALMLSSVFFDLRPIRDPAGLFSELAAHTQRLSEANRIFIAYMAANALKHRPPLGFFRNIVLISGGEHDHTFDIKHRGTVPIVDLARVYALSAGLAEINTIERLRVGAEANAVSAEGAANLIDALELIGTLRIKHQVRQLRQGLAADNYLAPDQLSRLERSHLKDAFALIEMMQESLGQRYQAARFT